jgi:DNA invertase Pin-like site-specific DNA recombinase
MIPAVLYAAKSTQDRHESIPTQLEDCREMAAENGWTVVREYSDEGFSAYSGNRGPNWQRAQEHAARAATESQGICMLVAQAHDRFARGAGDAPGAPESLGEVWHRTRRQNVHLRTVEDDEELRDEASVAAIGRRAHIDSRRKSKTVAKGMKRRRKGEQQPGGVPRHTGGSVYGYKRDEELGLVPDPLTGAVVVDIFLMAAGHKSLVEIATELQRRYEATGSPKPHRSDAWRQGSLSALVKRRTYLGEIPGDDPAARKKKTVPEVWVRAAHEPLPGMTEELWQAAQDAIAARARKPGAGGGRKAKGGHLLTKGMLRHATCGEAMTPVSGERRKDGTYRPVYICSGAKEGRCEKPPFRVERALVDEAVTKYLAEVGIDAEATLAALRNAAARVGEGTAAALDAARDEGARLEAEDARMFGMLKAGKLSPETWARHEKDHAEAVKANSAAVERLEAQAHTIEQGPEAVVPMATDALTLIREAISNGDQDAVRGALGTLFASFEVGEIGEIPEEAIVASPQEVAAARARLREQVEAMERRGGRSVAEAEADYWQEEARLQGIMDLPEYEEDDPLDVGLRPTEGIVILPMPRREALAAIVEDNEPVYLTDEKGRTIFRRMPLSVTTSNEGLQR